MAIRIQVQVNQEMLDKIDFYCGKMCLSRSSLCSMLIAQGFIGLDKAFSVLDSAGVVMTDTIAKEFGEQLKIDVKSGK